MFGTYIVLGITHETKDSIVDYFNLQDIMTETIGNYYGSEKAIITGAIRQEENIDENRMDDNIKDVKTFIDNIIRCDEEE